MRKSSLARGWWYIEKSFEEMWHSMWQSSPSKALCAYIHLLERFSNTRGASCTTPSLNLIVQRKLNPEACDTGTSLCFLYNLASPKSVVMSEYSVQMSCLSDIQSLGLCFFPAITVTELMSNNTGDYNECFEINGLFTWPSEFQSELLHNAINMSHKHIK